MTLQNLLAIRQLLAHSADRGAVLKMLDAARRNLADARVREISADALDAGSAARRPRGADAAAA